MSSGFSGRLFGFFASNCQSYTGIEPSTKTYCGLIRMAKDLQKCDEDCLFPIYKNVKICKMGSEMYNAEWKNNFDLCFTSPPYFDTEKYSDEETQSYIKFNTLESWLRGFLGQTIENCWQYTKRFGYMVINIADTPRYKGLEQSAVRYAKDVGFKHIDTLFMEMSTTSQSKGRKTEPIFVFRKA